VTVEEVAADVRFPRITRAVGEERPEVS